MVVCLSMSLRVAVQSGSFLGQLTIPATETHFPAVVSIDSRYRISQQRWPPAALHSRGGRHGISKGGIVVLALDRSSGSSNNNDGNKKGSVPNSNYVVPLDKSAITSCITRPLAEILRDLNKRIPDNIIKPAAADDSTFISWYHANRMLSFYAPGWCGEIRDVIFSENGNVTVVYRVTVRGSDGEAHRESTGTVSCVGHAKDSVAAAEEIAFCRACARFGLGLYLYHED